MNVNTIERDVVRRSRRGRGHTSDRQFVLTKLTIRRTSISCLCIPTSRPVFRDYPRIYFACHRRHVRDPKSDRAVSARQVSILDHLDADQPMMLSRPRQSHGRDASHDVPRRRSSGRQGYVTRVLDPVDRRKVQLRLTDAGVRVTAANSVLEPQLVEDMLDQLSDRDRRAALRGLELLGRAATAAQHARTSARRPQRKVS